MRRNLNTNDLELEENRLELEANRLELEANKLELEANGFQQQYVSFESEIGNPFLLTLIQKNNALLCLRACLINERVNLLHGRSIPINENSNLIKEHLIWFAICITLLSNLAVAIIEIVF